MKLDNFLLFLASLIFCSCRAIRMKDQIAISLSGPKQYCIRLLNGTASVGCQSDKQGNMGAVIVIENPEDITKESKNLPYGISKIIAVVNVHNFKQNMIDALRTIDLVVGVMLIVKDNQFPSLFSEDSVCPNERFYVLSKSELQTCRWNNMGVLHPDGFMFLSLNKPIIILSDKKDIDLVVDMCFNAFNQDPIGRCCMARITQFMNAAGNAEICRRRQVLNTNSLAAQTMAMCEPLQDYNVFTALPPRNSQNSTAPKVLMLATRMDISTIFAGSKGGDISTLTSIVSLLAVADAIGRNLSVFQEHANKANRQLLLSFFHGEAMGYIGSSRMVWEMGQHSFPAPKNQFNQRTANVQQIGLEDLLAFVEVQQLRASRDFNLHTSFDVYQRNFTLLDGLVRSIQDRVTQQGFSTNFHKQISIPFPPSSFHSVLHQTTTVPGLLLTGYGKAYESGHINSLADLEISQNMRARPEQTRYVSAAANALLSMVVEHVLPVSIPPPYFAIDEQYVNDLMNCFFYSNNWDCSLFHTILDVKKMPSTQNMFVGTSGLSVIRQIVVSLLVRSLGEKAPVQNVGTESQCNDLNKKQNIYNFMWQNDTADGEACCFRTSIYETTAKSPAFTLENYDFKSSDYSTWMQSTWLISPVELYLKPDFWLDIQAAITALIIVLASIPIKVFMCESWFIDSHEPPSSPHQL